MAYMTRRVLLNSMISGGFGMAMETSAEETEGAEGRRRELYGLLGDLPDRRRSVRWEPASAFHRVTRPSAAAEASVEPSALKATAFTA